VNRAESHMSCGKFSADEIGQNRHGAGVNVIKSGNSVSYLRLPRRRPS
jgi:hypothetical protein